jgi:hypothetical protein
MYIVLFILYFITLQYTTYCYVGTYLCSVVLYFIMLHCIAQYVVRNLKIGSCIYN